VSSFSERFLKRIGRHFVTLSCVQRLPGGEEEKVFIFSGFLTVVSGVWLYVTAGHILKDVRASLKAGGEFDVWRFDDQTAGNQFRGTAIPYVFDIDEWLIIEDEVLGFDYAVVPIDTIYRMQLEAGGAAPLGKAAWGDHVAEYDQWALVGIPSETVAYDRETIITGGIVVMPLEPTEVPPESGPKIENRFYARLKDLGNVADIDGMSGGPIFALWKAKDRWEYKVVGVQSSWYRSARIIAASPFASLAAELEALVESDRIRCQGEAAQQTACPRM